MSTSTTSHFSIPVTMGVPIPKVDGSASLRFVTNFELPPEEFVELLKLKNSVGWLLYSPNPSENVPKEPAGSLDTKSPSKRLRSVLYRLWEQYGSDLDFEQWYANQMEAIIQKFKDRLEDK